MRKFLFLIVLLVCSVGIAANGYCTGTTYYVAANGADTNNGTAKATPWLHAPGMNGCSGNCASYSYVAGDHIILRGGDSWFPAGYPVAGANQAIGLPWIAGAWVGTSGSPIYVGVDQTWFSGNSWARPIMNGGNPVSTTPVASCAYSSGGNNILLNLNNPGPYVTIDNFEFTGFCWTGSPAYGTNSMTVSNPGTLSNLYFHGWTHTSFSSGTHDYGRAMTGPTTSTAGINDIFTGIIVDGTDSDPTSLTGTFGDCWNLNNSTFRYCSNGAICNNTHLFYNNLFEYITESSDPAEHSNGFEFNSMWAGGSAPNLVYNNTVRHMQTAVTTWVNPNTALPTYFYNNLLYDLLQEPVNICGGAECTDGTIYIFNNTVESAAATPFVLDTASAPTFVNNHCIDTVGACTGGTATPTALTNLIETETAAAAAGYMEANKYAPTASGSPTVGQGTNEYTAINGASGPTTDILGVARPSSGAWDIGAYEYVAPPPAPAPTYTVTPWWGPNGTVSPGSAQNVPVGTSATLTVNPSTGYIATVGGSCGGNLAGAIYTTYPVSANCTVSVLFNSITPSNIKAYQQQYPISPPNMVVATPLAGAGPPAPRGLTPSDIPGIIGKAAGTQTLTSGSAAISVPAGSRAICMDTTAANPVKCVVATVGLNTTLTITGTGSDVINWFVY